MFYDLKVEILTFLFLRSEHYFGDAMWKAHAFMFTLVVLCHGAKLHLEEMKESLMIIFVIILIIVTG